MQLNYRKARNSAPLPPSEQIKIFEGGELFRGGHYFVLYGIIFFISEN